MMSTSYLLVIITVQVFHLPGGTPYKVNGASKSLVLDESFFDYRNRTLADNNNELELDEYLFEGDLEIPYKLYKTFYLDATAPTSVKSYLWDKGLVYYRFDQSKERGLNQTVKNTVRSAMDQIEALTCLRFVSAKQSNSASSMITFKKQDPDRTVCSSTSVGRAKDKSGNDIEQFIKLKRHCSTKKGAIIHAIGHAIGFWNTHSCPDRDKYIEIVTKNIDECKLRQFQVRKQSLINLKTSGYDYGSIMHYSADAFSKNGQETIKVIDKTEYKRQGSPKLGQREQLSSKDVDRIKSMYSCASFRGIAGRLEVTIKLGTLGLSSSESAYVTVTAVGTKGNRTRTTLSARSRNGVCRWNKKFVFGHNLGNWLFIRIQAFKAGNADGTNRQLTMSETVPIVTTCFNGNHCEEPLVCSNRTVKYRYRVRQECVSNRCYNRGTCIYTTTSYRCLCRSSYTGNRCQYLNGNLYFYAWYGSRLPKRDRKSQSDVYMLVYAYSRNGRRSVQRIYRKNNTKNPRWYQTLNFGRGPWYKIKVQLYDYDAGYSPDDYMGGQIYSLSRGGLRRKTLRVGRGFAYFGYSFG